MRAENLQEVIHATPFRLCLADGTRAVEIGAPTPAGSISPTTNGGLFTDFHPVIVLRSP